MGDIANAKMIAGMIDRLRRKSVSASFPNQMIYSANFQVSWLRIARGAKFKDSQSLLYRFAVLLAGSCTSPTSRVGLLWSHG
jgi:hypothetical protein